MSTTISSSSVCAERSADREASGPSAVADSVGPNTAPGLFALPIGAAVLLSRRSLQSSFLTDFVGQLAEEVGFEPTNGYPLPVFKTGAFDRSATLPV